MILDSFSKLSRAKTNDGGMFLFARLYGEALGNLIIIMFWGDEVYR